MTISEEASSAAYAIARQIYEGTMLRADGINLLVSDFSMNRHSASDYVNNFRCMIEGRCYTRTNNAFSTDYFLSNMLEDYGDDGLRNALSALSQHIEYYEAQPKGAPQKQNRTIHSKYSGLLNLTTLTVFPDEVNADQFSEGGVARVTINVYERNPIARSKCIALYGCNCVVCGFDFEKQYGEIGRSFIHVHHLKELSTIKQQYFVDPEKDLRPVCPNCHAMIHRKNPPLSISEVRQFLKNATERSI